MKRIFHQPGSNGYAYHTEERRTQMTEFQGDLGRRSCASTRTALIEALTSFPLLFSCSRTSTSIPTWSTRQKSQGISLRHFLNKGHNLPFHRNAVSHMVATVNEMDAPPQLRPSYTGASNTGMAQCFVSIHGSWDQ